MLSVVIAVNPKFRKLKKTAPCARCGLFLNFQLELVSPLSLWRGVGGEALLYHDLELSARARSRSTKLKQA